MNWKAIPLCLAVIGIYLLSACAPNVNGVPGPRYAANDSRVEAGRKLIAGYGCGSCH